MTLCVTTCECISTSLVRGLWVRCIINTFWFMIVLIFCVAPHISNAFRFIFNTLVQFSHQSEKKICAVYTFNEIAVLYMCFTTDCSMAAPLLQFLSVCASVISYVAFFFLFCFLSLFFPHRFFAWCLGRVVPRDCGISWVSSLIVLFVYLYITKTYLYNFDLLKPGQSYIAKLGFTWV